MSQRSSEQNPRQAAHEYQEKRAGSAEEKAAADTAAAAKAAAAKAAAESAPERRPKSDAEWRDLISHRIEEAMRNGAFDNLPNRGKPINLDRNPYAPEGMEMAFDLLKNNELAPAWIGLRRDLLRDLDKWRLRLAELVRRFDTEFAAASGPGAPAAAADVALQRWQAQREALQLELVALNKRIVDLNLQQPVAHLEIFKLILADELRAAGASTVLR